MGPPGPTGGAGANGDHGINGDCSPSGCVDYFDGGSGGGVLVRAGDLRITGKISVLGGAGGAPGTAEDQSANSGLHGGPGFVKIFAGSGSSPNGDRGRPRLATTINSGTPAGAYTVNSRTAYRQHH